MAWEDFFPVKKKEEVEYEEVKAEEPEKPQEKISVRIEKLGGVGDTERIIKYVKNGFIVFLKTQELQKTQLAQFQAAVVKLKRLCQNYGFDIVGTEEGYLILTPKFVTIER